MNNRVMIARHGQDKEELLLMMMMKTTYYVGETI